MPEQNESASSMTNVLIIDDENQIRKFLDIALRAQGYKTLLAENGQKGLELLALQGADLVILDLGLPDLDGYEVLSELRTWSHVPVIVLSVRANEEEKVKLLDAGANDSTDGAVHLRIEQHLSELHHANMTQTNSHAFYMPSLIGRTGRRLKKSLPDIACCEYIHVHDE